LDFIDKTSQKSKNSSVTEIRPVGPWLLLANGRTDMIILIGAFRVHAEVL